MKYQSIFLILLLVYCQWPVWLVSTFKLQYWRYRVNQPRETLLFCQRIFEIRHTTIFDIKDTTLRAAAWVEAKLLIIERVPLCHWFKWPLGLVRGLVGCQAAGHIPDTALQKEHVTVLSGFVPQLPHRLRRHHGRLLNLHQVAHQPLPLHPWRVSATSICRNLNWRIPMFPFDLHAGSLRLACFRQLADRLFTLCVGTHGFEQYCCDAVWNVHILQVRLPYHVQSERGSDSNPLHKVPMPL